MGDKTEKTGEQQRCIKVNKHLILLFPFFPDRARVRTTTVYVSMNRQSCNKLYTIVLNRRIFICLFSANLYKNVANILFSYILFSHRSEIEN